jgi:enoyl-CoA hydratase
VVEVEDHGDVTVVRLRHGKVNALDVELLRAITAVMLEFDERRAVVLTGTGSVFSAGADLRRIAEGGRAYVTEFLPALSEALLTVFDHPGPVVAAVNGHAIAGGCVLAAACDRRLMSAGTIGLAELSAGVPFPTVALEVMRHATGLAIERLVLTAAVMDPAEAREIGLIHHLESPAGLLDAAVEHARHLARFPAHVYAFSKRQVRRPALERIAARRDDDDAVLEIWSSQRARDRISGYLDHLRRNAIR